MPIAVVYDPEFGDCYRDGTIETIYQHFRGATTERPDGTPWRVGNFLFIERVRVGIAEGDIDPTAVVFEYDEETITHDKHGYLERWPKGFGDQNLDYLARLCRTPKGGK